MSKHFVLKNSTCEVSKACVRFEELIDVSFLALEKKNYDLNHFCKEYLDSIWSKWRKD